jgi:hypothetical protein
VENVFSHDAPIIFLLAAANKTRGLAVVRSLLSEGYLAWGNRKNDVELLEAANNFIDMLIKKRIGSNHQPLDSFLLLLSKKRVAFR